MKIRQMPRQMKQLRNAKDRISPIVLGSWGMRFNRRSAVSAIAIVVRVVSATPVVAMKILLNIVGIPCASS